MNWNKMEEILKSGDLKAFWVAYAQYLEENHIISRSRMVLYTAVKKTEEAL